MKPDDFSSDARRCCPIGIFDSGLGGLTVQKELMLQLPEENTVYFGDSGRTPYGTKSADTILHFADQDTNFLISQDVKMIVIACNTASSYAYRHLSSRVQVPVVEVIHPGALAAVKATRSGRIGVIGTSATMASNVYYDAVVSAAAGESLPMQIKVTQQACPLFVGLAEEGWWDNDVALLTARRYLEPLIEEGIDTLVLGCTHYPLLHDTISRVMGDDVVLINSAYEVVKSVSAVLRQHGLEHPGAAAGKGICGQPHSNLFFTSDSIDKFKLLGSAFLNMPIAEAIKIDIEKY
ncbi:MAG: glutamate racemase [Saccharofermentanales bacterium]